MGDSTSGPATGTGAGSDDPALRRLREEFTGHRIWRARRWDGRPGDWVATLHDPAAGIDATVIRPDAPSLREALKEERQRAGRPVIKKTW